jgi:hypothetical protein
MPEFDFRAPRLFVDAPLREGARIALERNQSNYLGNVLRLSAGETILVFNGHDGEWRAEIEGRKRLRVWPSEVLRRQGVVTHSLDYERFLDDSVALEGEPGDVIYWPSNYWHIGESVDGGLAVSLSLAIFLNDELPVDLSPAAEIVEERLGAYRGAKTFPLNPRRLRGSVRKLPRMSERVAGALHKAGQDRQLQQALQVDWMNSVTRFGLARVSPPLPRPPSCPPTSRAPSAHSTHRRKGWRGILSNENGRWY